MDNIEKASRPKKNKKKRVKKPSAVGKELIKTKLNLEKFYEKDIDELLDDSDWDLKSLQSGKSFGSSAGMSDYKVRGLESIYLQRLNAGIHSSTNMRKKKAKFRVLQDRTLDDIEQIKDRKDTENPHLDSLMNKANVTSTQNLNKPSRMAKAAKESKTAMDIYFPEEMK